MRRSLRALLASCFLAPIFTVDANDLLDNLRASPLQVRSPKPYFVWQDGDLVMVGSSRLAQPRKLFLGSTAAKMLRVLPVPMVVVPKHEFTQPEALS